MPHPNYLIVFPVIWVSFEVLRSYFLTGFPWLIIGTSLAGTSIGGWIPIFGTFGSSFLALIMSGCLIITFENRNKLSLYPSFIILIPPKHAEKIFFKLSSLLTVVFNPKKF